MHSTLKQNLPQLGSILQHYASRIMHGKWGNLCKSQGDGIMKKVPYEGGIRVDSDCKITAMMVWPTLPGQTKENTIYPKYCSSSSKWQSW